MDLFVTSKNNDKVGLAFFMLGARCQTTEPKQSEIQLVLVCKVLEFSELDALPYVKPLEQTVQV